MDDLSNTLTQVLQDPNALEQIKGLASMLGLNNSSPQAPPVVNNEDKGNIDVSSLLDDNMASNIMRIMPLLSEYKKEDDSTRLLTAIRPFLSHERKLKLDEATKLVSMMKLLPMIKELNILG